jgi:hypothetical protein
VPRHLLANPAFVRALRERDFTTVFATAHDAEISFNRIAEACALKADRVSQIARGTASVTALATVERIGGGLRIPGALLGLAAQPWEDTTVLITESDHGDDPMKRRNLLRGALAAGLTAPALAALTAARTDVDQTLSPDTPQDLADWRPLPRATDTATTAKHPPASWPTWSPTSRPCNRSSPSRSPPPSGRGCAGRPGRWPA